MLLLLINYVIFQFSYAFVLNDEVRVAIKVNDNVDFKHMSNCVKYLRYSDFQPALVSTKLRKHMKTKI